MMRTFDRFLRRDQRGGVLLTLGLSLPILLGMGALAIDVGYWYKEKREYQTAADAAAIGAAWERLKGKSEVTAAAKEDAARNGVTVSGAIAMTVNNPPTSGDYVGRGDAVEVILTAPETKFLAGQVFAGSVNTRVRAVAVVEIQGEACIFALDTAASSAVKIWGSSIVEAKGCVIGANSNASNAIDVGGQTTLTAESMWTVGNVSIGSNATTSIAKPPTTDAFALDDPYDDLTITLPGGNYQPTPAKNLKGTIIPGKYLGDVEFNSQADVSLEPGTYYIDNGDFTVNAGAKIRCPLCTGDKGVTIILTSSNDASNIGSVTINGGADVVLRAPTGANDTYKGVLFFQDPNAPAGHINKFNGGSKMILTGALYTPAQSLQFNGDNDAATAVCTQIIAKTIEFTGNSKIFNNGCAEAGIVPITVKGIRLVE